MTLSLYEMNEEMRMAEQAMELYAIEHDGEITDFPMNDIMKTLEGDMDEKALNVAIWIKNIQAESAMIKTEMDNLAKRKKTLDNKIASITNYLSNNIEQGKKLKNSKAVIGWRKSSSVNVLCEPELLPEEYRKTKTTVSADKKAIKENIESLGAYAEIVTKQNISIK